MVDRKHSLHILGNLITAGNITYCVPTWGQGERERESEREREREREGGREREGEGEGKRQREWERRREGETQIKNTSKVLTTSLAVSGILRTGYARATAGVTCAQYTSIRLVT